MEKNIETTIINGLWRDCCQDPFFHSQLTKDKQRADGSLGPGIIWFRIKCFFKA